MKKKSDFESLKKKSENNDTISKILGEAEGEIENYQRDVNSSRDNIIKNIKVAALDIIVSWLTVGGSKNLQDYY